MSSVPRIVLSLDDLSQYRVTEVKSLFVNLAKRKKAVAVNQTSVNRNYIIGVSDGIERGHDYNDWRFKTNYKDFTAMYQERWMPYKADLYYLERAYFHLYKTDRTTVKSHEFIMLHCDANEPDSAPHAKFKQSPHLHLSFAEEPLPHAHIALNNGNLKDILSSITALHNALKQAIDMIDEQILFLIENSKK